MEPDPRGNQKRPRSGWEKLGLALGIGLAVAGLAAVAAMVVVMIGLNSWANNK